MSIQVDVGSNIGDVGNSIGDVNSTIGGVNRSYRWSTSDLWTEKISRDLLRFSFLIFLLLEDKVVLIFW
jgi:hypothetical protein